MIMLPPTTSWPPNFFTPRRRPAESRPLREEPPAFLCAISSYSVLGLITSWRPAFSPVPSSRLRASQPWVQLPSSAQQPWARLPSWEQLPWQPEQPLPSVQLRSCALPPSSERQPCCRPPRESAAGSSAGGGPHGG